MKNLSGLVLLIALYSCGRPNAGPLQLEPDENTVNSKSVNEQFHAAKVDIEKKDVKPEPCQGCITISGLIGNKESYSGKVVRMRGTVTKVNPEIMGKNWIHIQDGTEANGVFDLTITSSGMAEVGETVTFEGKILLNQDFGFGYNYDILMSDAKQIK